MGERTGIEWTGSTWTPIRARHRQSGKLGWHCVHLSPGCRHCYAESLNGRLGTGLPFKPGHAADIEIILDEAMLLKPLRWKKPRAIFVCSMTDLFADFVPDEMIDRVFAAMALAPQHTFQVLTKRAARMRAYLSDQFARERIAMAAIDIVNAHSELKLTSQKWFERTDGVDHLVMPWPLRNIWAGVSAEDQSRADERIPELLATPAAVRFVSAEPLLGPIDFTTINHGHDTTDALSGEHVWGPITNARKPPGPKLDWIIVGGESGLKARAMHPAWVRSIRDQCAGAGTAFFFKQWGEWAPSTPEQAYANPRSGWRCLAGHPHVAKREELYPEAGAAFIEHMGKKAAGRLLDGVEHSGMPELRHG